MNSGDLNKVWEIKALKKAGEEEARKILERIAKQVQPITRKHKWRVKLLSEFCPKNPSLLGLNVEGGVHVKLRLRRPNNDWDFYPFDQILDTMLHELCHNAHGPHNASFYQLWDELRKECEDLMSKGITGTGEGFDLPGRRLGGFSHQPLSSLRKIALAAAEKRASLAALLPSGSKRLGGDNSIRVLLSPVQAAAMAAERRLQDNIWCGSEDSEESGYIETATDISQKPLNIGQNGGNLTIPKVIDTPDTTSRKRSHESIESSSHKSFDNFPDSNCIDLTAVNSECGSKLNNDATSHKRAHNTNSKLFSQSTIASKSYAVDLSRSSSTSGSVISQDFTNNREEPTMWQCLTCTLLNPQLAPVCELCSSQKPKDVQEKYNIWVCKFCTLENSVKLEKCAACDQWRYSYGAPVATLTSNFGT